MGATWQEKFPDITTMKMALESFDFEALLQKAGMSGDYSPQDLKAAALAMPVAHLAFADFHRLVGAYAAEIPDDTAPPLDTVAKLFAGLIHELEFRRDILKLPG
jgi:hypothetical protein